MCRFSRVIHKNGTKKPQNGTTALARDKQNGTVPCRLCRAVPCAVCAVSEKEKIKKKLSSDPRFAAWVAGMPE